MYTKGVSKEDSYPEDVGCSESPTCLACPLPICKFDDKEWYIKFCRERRYSSTMGMTIKEASKQIGVTERSILRYRAKERELVK